MILTPLKFLQSLGVDFLNLLQPAICLSCSARLPDGAVSNETPLCPRCLENLMLLPKPSGFLGAVCEHTGPGRDLVHKFKYKNQPYLSDCMARMMVRVKPTMPSTDLLIPVPLWSARERERGYNQAALLTDALSRLTHIPAKNGLLLRIRHTPTQTRLNKTQRKINVRNAFDLSHRARKIGAFRGAHVLLVDDVCTTGATLQECARTLLNQGEAASVGFWVFARAVNEKQYD